jgi:hypothetical protein
MEIYITTSRPCQGLVWQVAEKRPSASFPSFLVACALKRSGAQASLRRTSQYASLLRISGPSIWAFLSHLKNDFFRKLLEDTFPCGRSSCIICCVLPFPSGDPRIKVLKKTAWFRVLPKGLRDSEDHPGPHFRDLLLKSGRKFLKRRRRSLPSHFVPAKRTRA